MSSNSTPKGRRRTPPFVALQHRVLASPNFVALSPRAVKLLMDVCSQYRGTNNGDLCVTWSLMKKRGWRSKETLAAALDELLHFGWLVLSRQGGRHKPSLYAITWAKIDECRGKLDISATTVAPNDWQTEVEPFTPKRKRKSKSLPRLSGQCTPPIGSITEQRRASSC